MVVAQLVGWSIPTPEVRGSNPVIGKFYMFCQLTKFKTPGMAHINHLCKVDISQGIPLFVVVMSPM